MNAVRCCAAVLPLPVAGRDARMYIAVVHTSRSFVHVLDTQAAEPQKQHDRHRDAGLSVTHKQGTAPNSDILFHI